MIKVQALVTGLCEKVFISAPRYLRGCVSRTTMERRRRSMAWGDKEEERHDVGWKTLVRVWPSSWRSKVPLPVSYSLLWSTEQ
jgi:hypothetical protein